MKIKRYRLPEILLIHPNSKTTKLNNRVELNRMILKLMKLGRQGYTFKIDGVTHTINTKYGHLMPIPEFYNVEYESTIDLIRFRKKRTKNK
jgi:hypothetical protein